MTNAKAITEALRGRWYRYYGLAMCPAHANSNTPAMSVRDGHDGRLLAHCHAGCTFAEILDALRGLGILEGAGSYTPADPASVHNRRAEERAEAEKREGQALALWREAQPIGGTAAEAYLRGRGISCPLPETLRFHPACWHPTAKRFPALVAQVDGAERFAVHRTYLSPAGSGKAEVKPDKAMLGATAGGAVRLSEAQGSLAVAEGIETALSLACGLLRAPATIWAALSTSGIRGLHLPDRPGALIVASDGDDAGRGAAQALAERAHSLGWQVSLLPAPQGRDWNNFVIKGERA